MQSLNLDKNIVVTGSTGNLGKLIVNNIPRSKLTCIDIKNPVDKLPLNARFINFDITRDNLVELFLKLKPSTIIHTAFTVTPVKAKYRRQALMNDVKGTKTVLKAALRSKTSHIIYLSSTLAYGASLKNVNLLKETDPLQAKPNFHYSFHKRLVEEKICIPFMNKHSGPILTILRPSGILGPSINNYVTDILRWKVLPFMLEGKYTKIQWLHEKDLVQAVLKSIEIKKKGIFNITPDTSESYFAQSKYLPRHSIFIPEKLSRITANIMWNFNLSKTPPSYLDFVRYQFIASNEKAKKELKWSPKFTTKDSLLSIYS
jgi:UDP-glucose 4-epimerase